MQVIPYYLEPTTTWHIGRQGIEQEETRATPPSDTLYAALVTMAIEAGCPPGIWETAWAVPSRAPFWLGSAFPYAGGVRFYPMPQVDLVAYGLSTENIKPLRRIAFISEGIWHALRQGRPLNAFWPENEGGAFLQEGTLWLSKEEVARLPETMRLLPGKARPRPLSALTHLLLWENAQMPRVTVDRLTNQSAIYYTGRVAYAQGCGLWFPVAWRQPDASAYGDMSWRALFEWLLTLLADAGLGGDRAAGLGGFAWHAGEPLTWPDPIEGQPAVTLSRYHPRSEELPQALAGETARYRLTSVAGYLNSAQSAAQRRRRLWLLEEGSIIIVTHPSGMGDVVDVKPNVGDFPHPVWRYGIAFPIPLEVHNA